MYANFKNLFRKFHCDEAGLEALQVVMIIAIAGMVLMVVSTVGQEVVDWADVRWQKLKQDGEIK